MDADMEVPDHLWKRLADRADLRGDGVWIRRTVHRGLLGGRMVGIASRRMKMRAWTVSPR